MHTAVQAVNRTRFIRINRTIQSTSKSQMVTIFVSLTGISIHNVSNPPYCIVPGTSYCIDPLTSPHQPRRGVFSCHALPWSYDHHDHTRRPKHPKYAGTEYIGSPTRQTFLSSSARAGGDWGSLRSFNLSKFKRAHLFVT